MRETLSLSASIIINNHQSPISSIFNTQVNRTTEHNQVSRYKYI